MKAENEDEALAQLAGVLEPATYPDDELRAALRSARGDVASAAEMLLMPRIKSSGKRKAGTSLHSWLSRPRHTPANEASGLPELHGKRRAKTKPDDDILSGLATASVDDISKEASATAWKSLYSTMRPQNPAKVPKAKPAPQPPIIVANQAQIDAQGLPLTILESPLSPSFASALYLAMMEESTAWDHNRFYLAGRWVESPHQTTGYKRRGDGYLAKDILGEVDGGEVVMKASGLVPERDPKWYYSGTVQTLPADYPAMLAKAAEMCEPVINASLRKRARHPWEWAGSWRANVCGANRYDGAASTVGWHADQLSYLGPYTTIASLSLGTPRAFRLRQADPVDPVYSSNKPIRTYETTLGHNSLILMNAGCQERFKHTIPPMKALDLFRPAYDINEVPIPFDEQKTFTTRINITFRFYRDDFHPSPGLGPFGRREGTPYCKCGIPTLLRADQKAKARSRLAPSPIKPRRRGSSSGAADDVGGDEGGEQFVEPAHRRPKLVEDDMAFFWQCQSPGATGDLKGCGYFRILDMKAEGRGPCQVDL